MSRVASCITCEFRLCFLVKKPGRFGYPVPFSPKFPLPNIPTTSNQSKTRFFHFAKPSFTDVIELIRRICACIVVLYEYKTSIMC
ncbi:hypothetical protein QVD17_01096 [Tagetes erecta]|uniref:Uncharacterized protein n=1 Tax=Tagetes erecta TaxID=13708 RepID=A0AAD8L4D6_TARER|nr:hypothetical protein QVD17_01096 [Tagetes erecta]